MVGLFFPVHRADIAVSCAAIIEGCAETLNVLCGNGKFVVSFSFLHVGVGCSYFHSYFSLFSAKEEHVVKGKIVEYFPLLLSVAPMERIGGWSLAGEDPKLFSQDRLWKGGRREWPDEPYPTVSVAAGGARPKTTPVVSPADDEIEDPQPRGPFHPSDPQVKDLLQIHHSMVKLLRSMGVDACKEYSQSRLEVILDSIQSTDLECKVCGKVYKAAAKMKRHFRKRHLGKTNYKCDICEKYYTDAGSLKTHQSSHDSSKNPYSCRKCTKTFPTKGLLGQHIPVHEKEGTFVCDFQNRGCEKKFKWKKGKVEHMPKCDYNPDRPEEPPFQCHIEECPKGYWDKRSLLRHYREKPSHKPKE